MKNLKRILSFFIVMGFMFVMFGFRVGVKADGDLTAVFTISSKTAVTPSGDVTDINSVYSQTYGTVSQATSGNSFTLTLSGAGIEGKAIKSLTLSMKSNSSKGAGYLTVVAGTTTIASIEDSKFNTSNWYGNWSTSYVNVVLDDVTNYAIKEDESVVITIAATENSLYINKYTIVYGEPASDPSVIISSPSGTDLMMPNTLQLTSTIENITGNTEGVWSSTDTTVATVSSAGLVTPVAMGKTNIKLRVNNTYDSNIIALTVWPSNASNISFATAIEIAQFVGKDSESAFTYSTFGTITSSSSSTFVISDGAQTITVYKKSHGLSVGTSLVVTGNLTNYNGNTPEFTNPSFGYNVTFDTNGGNESYDSLTNLASGVKISDPGTPTRDGYNFVGWYNGENKWNFDTNTVTTSITLVARWASTAAQTAIKNALASTKAYMSLAYTYTASAINAPSVYTKATSVSQLSAGDSVIIVSKLSDGTYYAMTNSLSSSTLAKSEAITIEDGVITSDISSNFVWALYGNAVNGWDLKNGENFIGTGSNTSISWSDSENHKLTFVASGNNSYFLNNGTRTMFYANSNSGFKNFAISNIGKTEYAAEVYVFVKQATAKTTYNDVDFRIRCAIDAGLGDLNEDYAVTFGIEVSAGGKTVRYTNSDGASFQTSGGKQFVTLDLGDMLNTNYANLDTEFTVKAYVEYDGGIFYSENIKTFSVKGMVNQYYNVEHIDAVEGLKEILESYGYTFE